MIEFKGELTGGAKKYLLRKQMRVQRRVLYFLMPIPVAINIILGFYDDAFFWFLIVFATMAICILIPPGKNAQKIFMPKRIYVDLEEGTIIHICEKMERFHMISSVESVIDYGEWYDFVFQFEDRDLYFVCQKSLLTEGTLEEFESLFEGKIERRIDTQKAETN